MKELKTEMVGFGNSVPLNARKSAKKPKPRKSEPDKKLEEELPKQKRNIRTHMSLIEEVMAEARGTGGRGGKLQGGEVPEEQIPSKTKAGTKKPMDVLAEVFGAQPDNLVGVDPPQGFRRKRQVPHAESASKYVEFMAEMTVGSVVNPKPPRPTGG